MSDLISRSAFADVMCSACNEYFPDEPCEPSECDLCIALANAPAVDAVPVVHGRWKYYHKQNIAVCTNCSFERDLDANFGRAISCPNCGAKMDGGEDNG